MRQDRQVVRVVKGYFLILLALLRKEVAVAVAATMFLGLEVQAVQAVVAHPQVGQVE
jgi:hypothetical protein